MHRLILSGFLLFAVVMAAQNKPKMTKVKTAPAVTYGNSDSITEQEMKIYDYFLASDQLEGRNLPSRGFDTAALYVASHLAEWGLKPGGSLTHTNGPLQPYLMPFELVTKAVIPGESKASLTAPGGGGRGGRGGGGGGGRGRGGNGGARTTEFEYGKDWTVTAGGRGAAPLEALEVSGNLAFAGNGYIVKKTNIDPFQGIDVKGKIVVVAGLPPEIAAQQAANGGRGGGRGAPNPLGEPCTDFLTPEEAAAKNGAIAVVTLQSFQQLAGANAGGFGGGRGGGLNGPAYTVPMFKVTPACPVVPAISAGLAMTNDIFQGEKKNGSEIFYGAGSNAKQDSFELTKEKKLSLKVAVKSEAGHAENVVGIIEGGDPVKKNEYVVISAHLDHIGLSAPLEDGHNVNNGADDDGSGSTALLAIARAYSEGAAKGQRPERSIIFLWNAGEEKGLWGSQYFNEFPFIDLTKVVANLNIDMIGRTKGPGYTDPDKTHVLVDQGEILLVGPNISSDELEKTIETVNDGYQKLKLNHFYDATKPDKEHDNLGPEPNGQRIFYRSDHYNFAKVGIPIVFFTTGLHPDYHRPTDTPDKIDFKEMMIVTKTVSAVGWVLANQEGRPALNKTLPEQLMKDMKQAKDQGWGKITPVLAPLPGEPF
jgi:Zn-dependent M28 family amino/carboxypeptidase